MKFAVRAIKTAEVQKQLMKIFGLRGHEICCTNCAYAGIKLLGIRDSSIVNYRSIRNVDVLCIGEVTENALANVDFKNLLAFFHVLHAIDPREQFDCLRHFVHSSYKEKI